MRLQLADVEGSRYLTIGEARLIRVSVSPELARRILEATDYRSSLLHASFDTDVNARTALHELGCVSIYDENLLTAISDNAEVHALDTEWLWSCWEWVAAWVDKEPSGDKHTERMQKVQTLPIVPVEGQLRAPSDLANFIVTWRPEAPVNDFPDWLPLVFVADWFRLRITSTGHSGDLVRKLCKDLGISGPTDNVIQRATGVAIERYWEDERGNPERFLLFILEQNWHERDRALPLLRRCPVRLSSDVRGNAWSEACKAYFGREWDIDLLADLYDGCEDVPWVQRKDDYAERERTILRWLGCTPFPRVIEERGPNDKGVEAGSLPHECHAWRDNEYRDTERIPTVDVVSRFEHLSFSSLNSTQVSVLLVLLERFWDEYYHSRSNVQLTWFYRTERSRNIRAFWWFQVLHELRPLTTNGSTRSALADCWLPDKRTEREIGELLPVIELDAFGENKDRVRYWLIDAVALRQRMEQLAVGEWTKLLSRRIPDIAPEEKLCANEGLRDKVTRWYAACLDTVSDQEMPLLQNLDSLPLLCRKSDSWKYVSGEGRYLNDDEDLGRAFAEDVWLVHLPARLARHAMDYFELRAISRSVEVNVTEGNPKSRLSDGLQTRFTESLPYVWAWRSSQSKHAAEGFLERLKVFQVHVVPTLIASMSLDDVQHEGCRSWHVTDDHIFLHKDHENEAELAQALAKALDVRSEADFYENLLRCENEEQRKRKLISKGITAEDISRSVREYTGEAVNSEQGSIGVDLGPRPRPSPGPSFRPSPLGPEKEEADPLADYVPPNGEPEERPLALKDVDVAAYEQGGLHGQGSRTTGPGVGGGGGQAVSTLTDEQKVQLENAGRRIAKRELIRMEFLVDVMPFENPGFDLKATKDGKELRVEVKAHRGGATVVEITQRQYREYLLHEKEYGWQLWNIEHLDEQDSEPIRLSRYNELPDDALVSRTFRLDLKKCRGCSDDLE